jgi:outer membrane lipoprotein-sorting protein
MKMPKLVIVITCLLWPVLLFAQVSDHFKAAGDPEMLKDKIREAASKTNTISSSFIQEKHLTMMEEVLVSNGRFFFRKENNVKWEYLSPISYAIIIRGNSFIINNEGKINEFDTESNRLFKEINNMIIMAIKGDFVDKPEFEASFYEDDEFVLTVLRPNDEMLREMLTTIEIRFSKPSMDVVVVRFVEPGEDFTLIRFSDRKYNIEIDDAAFDVQ